MNIDEALERFLVQLEADGRLPHTIGQYRRHIRALAAWARDVDHSGDVSDITHEDLARFLAAPDVRASARGGTKKASTTNCLRTSVQGFCSYLHRAGVIAADPSRVLRRAKCGRPPPRGLSDDDATRLLETLAAADGADHVTRFRPIASNVCRHVDRGFDAIATKVQARTRATPSRNPAERAP